MDDSDILSFGHTSRTISFKAALRNIQSNHPKITSITPADSSSQSSDGSEGEEKRRGRKRGLKMGGRESSLASQLIHNQLEPCVVSSDSDEDCELGRANSRKKMKPRTPSPSSSDPSCSPSPEPSPPQPGSERSDQKSRTVLNKASNAIHQLIFSSCSTPGSDCYVSDLNDSLELSAGKQSITLRVRYRGRIRRYTINKSDPLSKVCSKLVSDLGEESTFLLSHKTNTLCETESPLSLGLTTADIIDAVKLSKVANNASSSPSLTMGDNNIQIKVQTMKKSIMYGISRTDPLQKAMEAFAKEVNTPLNKLVFSFDGDPISPSQTAQDLDMEDRDCIDVRLT